jgi:hypothetical protein
MVGFEKGEDMKSTEYSSVSEALEALKKINLQEDEILDYVKTQMKLHAISAGDSGAEKQLKEFFHYLNNQKQKAITLPMFQ